jgi:hypothetical protein
MEVALGLGRKMTLSEEDNIIERFHGKRNGNPIRWFTAPGMEPNEVPVLLPDPMIRQRHRAERLGGPTTEGEPKFEEYYRRQYSKECPVELRESGPATDEIFAFDGTPMFDEKAKLDYENMLREKAKIEAWKTEHGTEELAKEASEEEDLDDAPVHPKFANQFDPVLTQSFSQLGKPEVSDD